MKTFFNNLKKLAIAGFFFLLPVFVIFIIITKAWTALNSVGAKIAAMFGMKSILGLGSATIFTSLLLILICVGCGLLVKFSFMKSFSKSIERGLSKYIPGYDTYKNMAEEKLQNKVKELPYTSALIRQQDYWQPAYIVEQDNEGNYVIFLPDIPDTNTGRILLAKKEQVQVVSAITANQLDSFLKKTGKGLLERFKMSMQLNQDYLNLHR